MKTGKKIAEGAFRAVPADFLEVGFFYSSVGLRLTCRFFSGRDAHNFFPVEETTLKDTAHCSASNKPVLFLTQLF